ncbi:MULTISPECIES: glycoside hydrolase family 13 protein [unclassified Duganella]|uniref:glycoside hydrolase family 13 protein n=1 Tax=unclassified Duganella TaxID=2636909 RepID=UPI0008809396|nr:MULTISPECIES: glycoside hydrolase family 13 protein [unclassified Duganella]SDF96780.1 Glycosidase [Duganella sp. OV458]SDJ07986.1 Glycosidase [Duganella sp. OV510]
MKKALLATLFAALTPAIAGAAPHPYRIDHMDPPLWWTGMHNSKLQLMVHGPQIADLDPALNYPGVRIASVSRVASRNYLFIDLEIAPEARPGKLELVFQRGTQSIRYPYELLARAAGSAQRAGFNSADAIYQVMPDRFANGDQGNDSVARYADQLNRADGSGRHGGDIQGIINHLDYVAGMGFTQLWPTPLLESNMPHGSYHGYASTDHYRIDPRYGSNQGFRQLVTQARAKGIGVIQDVVLNHIGNKHWWMQDMPMPDWLTYQGKYVPTAHHRVAVQDPYASDEDKRNFTQGWFVQGMPDLNQANPYVANYLIQNSIWWIEYAGLSGLRVDTYGYSNTDFLSRWSGAVMAEYPQLNLVGEEWSPLIPVVAHWQRGKRNFDGYVSHMPSMMDFPLNDALRRALVAPDGAEQSLTTLYETLSQDYLYPDAANLVLFEGNHDLSRIYNALDEDQDLFRMAMAVVATLPRIPQFYAGTEIQMTSTTKGRDDASYRRDFPGGWAGDKVNAFTGEGLTQQQASAQAYIRKLLNWRKTAGVIHHGKLMHYGPEQNTYVYFRYDGAKKVMVALNKNKTDTTLPTARFHEMLNGARAGVDVISGQRVSLDGQVTLPARSALILEIEQ